MTPPEQSQQQIERLLRWNAQWTTALLGLYLVLMVGTAWIVVLEGRRWLDADRVVDAGESYLKERYPGWREELKQAIVEAAPVMAQKMTKRLGRSMVRSRTALEDFLVRADIGIDSSRTGVVSEEMFREYVQGERKEVSRILATIRAAPDEGPKVAAALEQSLDGWFGKQFSDEATGVLTEFTRLNARLSRLTAEEELTDLEKVERRIAQRLRALQALREKGEKADR